MFLFYLFRLFTSLIGLVKQKMAELKDEGQFLAREHKSLVLESFQEKSLNISRILLSTNMLS